MRTVRLIVPGITYHLISRFVERRWFLRTNDDRALYLRYLGRALENSDWRCFSYALMSSHIHLGMVAGTSPLETWTKRAHGPFASAINLSLDRIGPVFARGPKDHAVEDSRIPALIAYQHNNPVRAGVVKRATQSTWTSHAAYLGRCTPPPWLDIDYGMTSGNFADAEAFDDWVNSMPEDPSRVDVGGVRRAARRAQLEFATPTGDGMLPIVTRRSAIVRPDPRMFVAISSAMMGVRFADIVSRTRRPAEVRARRVAVHAALAFGVVGSDIGAALGLSVSGVSRIKEHALDQHDRAAIAAVIEYVSSQVNTVPIHRQ